MKPFAASWLQLREPSDRLAREAAVAAIGEERWLAALRGDEARAAPSPSLQLPPMQVLDLGCGTGASLRFLAPRLGGEQHWRLCDHDESLLQALPDAMAAWARREGHRFESRAGTWHLAGTGFTARIERRRLDLAQGLDTLPFDATDLLCATALIDLVSHAWLAELIGRARRVSARLSFALAVDGRIEWAPAHPGDADVAQSFARHQGRDKGFGPALGAAAPEVARALLADAGYAVEAARSDWLLQGGPLQAALIAGMAAAALEQDPQAAPGTQAWRRLRTAALERSHLRVGHVELVAVPPARA
ncbi:MAG: class I SAM-dependent methyltransferase [Burkholderiales bacterium]|nr:class I SAM-dependent methyltransferase [Burkholderiales bacterium]